MDPILFYNSKISRMIQLTFDLHALLLTSYTLFIEGVFYQVSKSNLISLRLHIKPFKL